MKSPKKNQLATYLVIFILSSVSIASIWLAMSDGSIGGLQADRQVSNLGEVWQGSENSTSFTLKNAGDRSLEITRLVAGCSCTDSVVNRRQLAAGEEATLTAVFNAGTLRGNAGSVMHVFYRMDDFEGLFRLDLRLTALVKSDYTVFPSKALGFATLNEGNKEVIVSSDEGVTVVDAYCTHPAFSVDVKEIPQQSEQNLQSIILVHFDRMKWDGNKFGEPKLVIKVASRYQSEFHLPIKVAF